MIPTAKEVLIETVDGSYILSNVSHDGNQTFQRFLVAVYDTYFKHKLDPRFSIDDFVNSKNHVEELEDGMEESPWSITAIGDDGRNHGDRHEQAGQ